MKRIIEICTVAAALAIFAAPRGFAQNSQDWFKTGTGLGVQKVRLAVPQFAARNAQTTPLEQVFHQVLMDDLTYSGIVDMVSPSFYPLNAPSVPNELQAQQWSQAPANAMMVAFGNLTATGNSLSLAGYLYDVRQTPSLSILEKIYNGAATQDGARQVAHQFADDIISRLSGGVPGIAESKIAFVSNRSGHKEIWEMDYDGANQQQLTHLDYFADTAMVAGRFAYRVYVLRVISQSYFCADLHVFDADQSCGLFPALPRHEFVSSVVSRWKRTGVHGQREWRSGNLRLGSFRTQHAPADVRAGSEHRANLESKNGEPDHICERSRRSAGLIRNEFGRIECAEDTAFCGNGRGCGRFACDGICGRSNMVAQRRIDRV